MTQHKQSHMLDAKHVSCYGTACARTVRIMHGWGGGRGGRGCMRCRVTHVGCYGTAHTCFMTQLHVLVLFVSCTDGVGGAWAWLHALSCHTCWMRRNCTYMFHATQLHLHTHAHMLTVVSLTAFVLVLQFMQTATKHGNQRPNVAQSHLPVLPTIKCSSPSGTPRLD